ncbi:MAG: hypothetical protein ABIR52_03190 [Casimicrobiaceae bacterium]
MVQRDRERLGLRRKRVGAEAPSFLVEMRQQPLRRHHPGAVVERIGGKHRPAAVAELRNVDAQRMPAFGRDKDELVCRERPGATSTRRRQRRHACNLDACDDLSRVGVDCAQRPRIRQPQRRGDAVERHARQQ